MESLTLTTVLGSAWRLWTCRDPGKAAARPSDLSIAGFALTGLLLWLLRDRLQHGPHAEFEPYAITSLSWIPFVVLTVAWTLSRVSRPPAAFRSNLFLLVVLAPIVICIDWALGQRWQTAAALLSFVYGLLYLSVGLRHLTGRPQIPAIAATLCVTSLAIVANHYSWGMTSLWIDRNPELQAERAEFLSTGRQHAEELLFSQPERIESMVKRIKPPAAAQPAIYFVGFAGVGRQKVFAEEIKLAAQRIGARYGAADREVLLLNDRRDHDSYPLATASGLRLALKDIASRMNVDRDVLFLALSSHGSAEPELSVTNGLLPLRQLTGTELAAALRESGIKWKIIVISACHAGAFIPALRDANTIILTAAAADRTSFGCSDDRDLTYFGEAFYRDALPRASSLSDAFAKAQADIAAREGREHITPSNPQAFFGSAMARKLAEIEATVH